jgi:hypothetical protein
VGKNVGGNANGKGVEIVLPKRESDGKASRRKAAEIGKALLPARSRGVEMLALNDALVSLAKIEDVAWGMVVLAPFIERDYRLALATRASLPSGRPGPRAKLHGCRASGAKSGRNPLLLNTPAGTNRRDYPTTMCEPMWTFLC